MESQEINVKVLVQYRIRKNLRYRDVTSIYEEFFARLAYDTERE